MDNFVENMRDYTNDKSNENNYQHEKGIVRLLGRLLDDSDLKSLF